jgi:signal transduction histidine kinase/CheY-like chemotaxis protein
MAQMLKSEGLHKSLLPLFAGFSLLLVTAASVIWLSVQQRTTAELVRHTLEVENKLNHVLSLATDAETGQRGFLLTGKDTYLEPYETAKAQLTTQIDVLKDQTTDSPTQQSRTEQLKPLAASKLAELERAITLRATGHGEEALALVNNDSGKAIMDHMRAIIGEMRLENQRALRDRSARADMLNELALAGLVGTALLLVGVAFLALRDARQRLLSLEAANARLQGEIRERSAAQGQVRQLQKMEAVGQLTGGIAHDFNNMLAVVIGSLDVARRRLTGSEHPNVLKCIDNASEGAARAAVLTARLLAFSRQQPLEPRVVDANKLVSGMSELLRRTLGETIKIETVLAGGLWRTHADPAQVESALVNLAVNSRDAMPSGGLLTIETANTDLDDRYAASHTEVVPGQYVMISVTDTGEGMRPDVIERAFDPFYTTKQVGKGTGLGLSQVFGFVKQSAGHVKIYSEVGHGTTVKLYLPRYSGDQSADIEMATKAAQLPVGHVEDIILVVEDEARVRQVSVDALRELGYSVLQAASPSEALQQQKDHPGIKLLFTDIVMPEMSGRQLADKILEAQPNIKVLYTTGYTRNAVVHNGVIDPGTFFLPKPFTIEQLALKVRQVLDS